MKTERTIDPAILGILSRMELRGDLALAYAETLDRATYSSLNRVLNALGGTWDRKRRGHAFADDPAERFAAAIATGSYTCARLQGFFPTPAPLANRLAAEIIVRVGTGVDFLEPSAGEGALALALSRLGVPNRQIDCMEIDEARSEKLRAAGLRVMTCDFLATPAFEGEDGHPPYRGILMNPPFNRGLDVLHLSHALDWLHPEGSLRAIVSAGIRFRTDRATRDLNLRLLRAGATIEDLPLGSFSEAGTAVRTCVVRVDAETRLPAF